jgi:hypothetical protein
VSAAAAIMMKWNCYSPQPVLGEDLQYMQQATTQPRQQNHISEVQQPARVWAQL